MLRADRREVTAFSGWFNLRYSMPRNKSGHEQAWFDLGCLRKGFRSLTMLAEFMETQAHVRPHFGDAWVYPENLVIQSCGLYKIAALFGLPSLAEKRCDLLWSLGVWILSRRLGTANELRHSQMKRMKNVEGRIRKRREGFISLVLPFSSGLIGIMVCPEVPHSGQAKREPESRAVDYSRCSLDSHIGGIWRLDILIPLLG